MCFRRSRASSHGVYASMIEPLGSNCKQSAMVPSTIVVIQKFFPLGIKGVSFISDDTLKSYTTNKG